MMEIRAKYDLRGKTAVLHPAVNSRVPETVIAFAVAEHGRVEVIGERCREFAERLGATIVTEPSPHSFVVVTDAHLLPVPPTRWNRIVGEMPEKGHWMLDLPLHRVSINEVLAAYPQELTSRCPRKILLKDVSPDRPSLGRFGPRRLKVRTSKASVRGYLTPRQALEAASQEGEPIVSFDLSGLQKRYLAMKRLAVQRGKKPRFLVLKYRRGGITTTEQAQSYHLCSVKERSMVATLAHTKEATQRIFRMVSLFHEHDPKALKLISDSKSALEMENRSLFFIGTAGGEGFSRGDTLSRVHGSEVSRWCHGDIDRVRDLIAAIKGAAEHGEIVLETTAFGREWFCMEWEDAKRGVSDFTPIFLPWFLDPGNAISDADMERVRDLMDDSDRDAIRKYHLTDSQVAFRQEKRREFKHLFPQEYPEDDVECFLTSGTMFFPLDVVRRLLATVVDVSRTPIRNGYEIIWEKPRQGEQYVIGADTSEGVKGGDPNGLGVMHKRTRRQVASVHGLFTPVELAHHIRRMHLMYNQAMIGVERQNHGHAVLVKLADLGSHRRGGSVFYYADDRAGWNTDGQGRDLLLDELNESLMDGSLGVNDRDFLAECTTFRQQPSGRWDHDPGAHDDTIFKWGIALQMTKHRVNAPSMAFA